MVTIAFSNAGRSDRVSRLLHITYDEIGFKIGRLSIFVDDTMVAKLFNKQKIDVEISNEDHEVCIKWGFLPIFYKKLLAGENNWALSFEQKGTNVRNASAGRWVLYECKPFYGKQI